MVNLYGREQFSLWANDPQFRDPSLSYNVLEFFSSRWTPEEKAKHGPYDWIPFGAGPRNCVAMRLALTEFKIAMVYLIRAFKFVKTEKTEVRGIQYVPYYR